MNERKLSELQKEYRAFFLDKMRLYGVKSPAELTKEKKSEFFTEIKQDWAKHKISKKQLGTFDKKKNQPIVEEPEEIYTEKTKQEPEIKSPFKEKEWHQKEYPSQHKKEKKAPLFSQYPEPHQLTRHSLTLV